MNGFKIWALQDLSHMLPAKYLQVYSSKFQPCQLQLIKINCLIINNI